MSTTPTGTKWKLIPIDLDPKPVSIWNFYPIDLNRNTVNWKLTPIDLPQKKQTYSYKAPANIKHDPRKRYCDLHLEVSRKAKLLKLFGPDN